MAAMSGRLSATGGLVLVAMLAVACASPSGDREASVPAASPAATTVSRGNGPFTLEWSVAPRGRIVGRIRNDYHDPARRIRLLVEALDAADRVIAQRYAWLAADTLGPNQDRYFEIPDVPPADRYRVLVHAWDIIQAPGLRWP
jgi:hypothetical protein